MNKKGNFTLTKNKFSVEITYEIIQLSDNVMDFRRMESLKKSIFLHIFIHN